MQMHGEEAGSDFAGEDVDLSLVGQLLTMVVLAG